MQEAVVYNKSGKEAGKVKLPVHMFDVPWNADLVHQVVVSMQSNARVPVAHAKDRSEVSGGGRKPWRQKGTGRARHGSRRSPIWTGGGVTFGPRNDRDYAKKINKKMRAKAFFAVLSQKKRDNEVVFLDSLSFSEPKTKEAKAILDALSGIPAFSGISAKKKNAALIATPENDAGVKRSFRNMGHVAVEEVRNLNPVRLLSYKYVIITEPERAIELFGKRGGGHAKEVSEAKTETRKTPRTPKKAPAKKTAATKKTARVPRKKTAVAAQ